MDLLPVLISIPHGGWQIPPEVEGCVSLSRSDLSDDVDLYSTEIYDLKLKVTRVLCAEIARSIVDLNRARNELPPDYPDGAIKTTNCYQRPVYNQDRTPMNGLADQLLDRYYTPYHLRIEKALDDAQCVLALDCHTMAASGPPVGPDPGRTRPSICLGNANGEACSPQMLQKLADCFRRAFKLDSEEVTLNHPFSGGHITRTYGLRPIPWVQVELSRSMYLPGQPSREVPVKDRKRLRELNSQFECALQMFF